MSTKYDTPLVRKWRWLMAVLADPKLSGAVKSVASRLADHSNDKFIAWPGNKAMANDLGLSVESVNKAVAALRAAGYIERLAQATSKGHAAEWKLNLQHQYKRTSVNGRNAGTDLPASEGNGSIDIPVSEANAGTFVPSTLVQMYQPTCHSEPAAKAAAREARGNPAATAHTRICEIVGKDPTKDMRWADWRVVQQWLNEGFDPERDIYPTIQRRMAGGADPRSPAYFTKAIREAHESSQSSSRDNSHAPANGFDPDHERASRIARLRMFVETAEAGSEPFWNEGEWGKRPSIEEAKAELEQSVDKS